VNPELAIITLREALQQRLDELADEAVELIVAEIPAYRNADDRLRSDVREHVISHLRASLESLSSGRDVTPEDLLFVRPHAARRAKRVPVADFVRAFYVGERVLWDAALSLADDEQSRQAALAFASHLPRYFEVATTHAAEVYVEAQEQLAATGERIRRDLLEDLLTGRELEPGPRLDAARAVGLSDGVACLVISAIPRDRPADEQLLRGGAAALARATASRVPALAVVRRDEIVVVATNTSEAGRALADRLETTQRRLSDAGLELAVGVSTVVASRALIPDAYREAGLVRTVSGGRPGVADLGLLSAFEYLTLRPDATASRLIASSIHEFVAQDSHDGGQLVATLREYVACDLNGKRAAENLHIHVNTAHYRLARIAERTGCDLRRVADLLEILIAARLADARNRASDA
jgi:DNA-binding PucR family transcriptional regulator